MKRIHNGVLQNTIDEFRSIDISEIAERVPKEYSEIGDSEIYGGKYAGSDAEKKGAEYIANEMRKIGVDNVEVIEFDTDTFQFNDATLTVVEGSGKGIVYKPGPNIAVGTTAEGVTAELVDVGAANYDFFKANDVSGKIILVEAIQGVAGVEHGYIVSEAERRGAVGAVVFHNMNVLDEETLRCQASIDPFEIPCVAINLREARELRVMLEKGKVVVNLTVDAKLCPGTSKSVIAEIYGENKDERIIFSSHLDHYFRCMQDNISAITTLMGISQAMKESGYKPNRTITFVFNSAHEVGNNSSLASYISGAYKVMQNKKEWIGKVILDINFEYSALSLPELRCLASYETVDAYMNFLEYMPEKVYGFNNIPKEVRLADYSFNSWADTVNYISFGMPVVMNDSISAQLYLGTSPYVGRDHSTSDNWDTFDIGVLKESVKWYGSMGIYYDQMPLPEYNFKYRTDMMALTEDEAGLLNQLGIDAGDYVAAVDKVAAVTDRAFNNVIAVNDASVGITDESKAISSKLLKVMKDYSEATDLFSGSNILMARHKVYLNTLRLLCYGKVLLEQGEGKKAAEEVLIGVDYGYVTYTYGKEWAEHIQEYIDTEKGQLWNKGKVVSAVTLVDILTPLKEKVKAGDTNYDNEIKLLDKLIKVQCSMLTEGLAIEAAQLNSIANQLEQV